MQKLVYSLNDAPDDAAIVGGKAAGLSRLIRYGVPVPPGFVLSADAYWTFLEENGLADGIAGPTSSADALAQLRSGLWPARLRRCG